MSIKKFFFRWCRIHLFALVFLIGFICGVIVVFLLCDIDFLIGVDVQSEKIDKIRTSEIAEGNYEIENWTAYEKKGDRLFFCDGSLYEFSPKYVLFRLTNGLLFGNSFKESTLYEESEKDSQEYPYMRIGNLLWMAKNLSIQPKEKDLVFFDAVAGLKIMPRSACLYNKESNCGKYGRFYDYSLALSICPDGWRLPKNEEWATLKGKVGKLKFVNEFAGFCRKNDSGIYEYVHEGTAATWWSDGPVNTDEDSGIFLDDNEFYYIYAENKDDFSLRSVRCVKEVSDFPMR